MVGPFGGTTAAVVLQSVLQHPELLGAPVALTVNYAAAHSRPARSRSRPLPVRTNRSTQHWTVQMSQADAEGSRRSTTTGTAFTALRRETWGASDLPMPEVPRPSDGRAPEHRPGERGLARPATRCGRSAAAIPAELGRQRRPQRDPHVAARRRRRGRSTSPALAAMSDMFYPRVWLRRATPVPVGTVSITTYFHADAAQLAEVGAGYLLGRAHGQQFRNGYFDQAAQLWSEAGRAAGHQQPDRLLQGMRPMTCQSRLDRRRRRRHRRRHCPPLRARGLRRLRDAAQPRQAAAAGRADRGRRRPRACLRQRCAQGGRSGRARRADRDRPSARSR